ncbi:MAG TPA: serine/threonine-protein kinase [Vicinamibacteria bacterium]|nr:serine/threonine-protein kinase [Vicinamibacteria bacterium]
MPSFPDDDEATPRRPSTTRRTGWLERLFGSFTSSSSAIATQETATPERIGRYRILHKLGKGGMGTVYAAEDPSLGRRIALKTINHPDDESRLRFRREARAAASVSHPHACQIFEIGEDTGRLFIAMELLDGEPLSERLKRGPLPLVEALSLGREMLAALGALHAQGVVHRDLKPSNVFLTTHGTKLLDFGLARPLPTDSSGPLSLESDLTRSGLMVGTPRYMAPEQILGDPIDARTDVFAAGAVLFEALAARPAFPGTKAVEVLQATLHEQPPALAGSPTVVAFDRVIRRALAKSPADRYPTAEAMSHDIAGIVPGDASESAAPALALTRLVVLPFRVLRPDPEIDFLSLALADAVSTSLSGMASLVVRSSAAGSRFATEAPDLQAIATQLDVDLVLLGTLLRSGDRLRVSTQLVEAPAGTLTWSHTAQSEVGDVFRLQDELAQGIVTALSPSLGGSPRIGRPGETPATARAYEFYLRGNEVAREWVQLPVARDLYLRCVAEDPGFAPAWARLGRAHRLIGKYLEISDLPRHQALAEEALRRALELSPRLPLAHKLLAHLEAEVGRAQDAMVRLLGLARETRNDPELFAGLVHVCRYSGLLEASLAAHREAQRLDPHLATGVVHTLWLRGDFQQLLELTGSDGQMARCFALLALGRQAEALDAWEDVAKAFSPMTPEMREWLDAVRGFLTLSEISRPAVFKSLDGAVDPEEIFFVGTQAARLGMPEATTILGRAVDAGYPARDALAHHPWMASIRGEPGFADVLQRAEQARERALGAFREAGGEALLGL